MRSTLSRPTWSSRRPSADSSVVVANTSGVSIAVHTPRITAACASARPSGIRDDDEPSCLSTAIASVGFVSTSARACVIRSASLRSASASRACSAARRPSTASLRACCAASRSCRMRCTLNHASTATATVASAATTSAVRCRFANRTRRCRDVYWCAATSWPERNRRTSSASSPAFG